jgi:hypothetical protein
MSSLHEALYSAKEAAVSSAHIGKRSIFVAYFIPFKLYIL